ncbi:MAG: acyl-CoA dehydratase activase [Chloroflexota bacterium]
MQLGIDIGSVTAKAVVISDTGQVLTSRYVRTLGRPLETILAVLREILAEYPPERFTLAAVTGSGGRLVADVLGLPFVNEISAQASGTARFHPEVRSILEIGGEDSKLIILSHEEPGKPPRVADFITNGVCAAGTGSFLDQQAARMGIPIAEFGEVAEKSSQPPHIAGRCSVFAKTDMIHLQQVGTPVHDIAAGLCFAMVRNFKGTVIGGRDLEKPVSLQGGVAANKGIRRAILEVLELKESELIIPEHFALLGAIGAALIAGDTRDGKSGGGLRADALACLNDYLTRREHKFLSLPPLAGDDYPLITEPVPIRQDGKVEAYVGVDIGSISTNVVVIDRDNNVLARRYLMTAGKPIEAVKQGLYEVGQEIGDRVIIKGAGSTGSGRYMTGEFFGADVVRNEITSHAKAASTICPEADTIFEIGGQDAKYISLQNGVIVDFAMNKVCAAGTGSFLEEQAGKLGLKIDDFGGLALAAKQPLDLGERCTVFMESQLNYHKQTGATKENLLGGLAYSIVKNYLNKVVEEHHVGEHILFQGGVGFNRSVKAAFESVLGKKVTVPPHHDILGALGVAMLAMEKMQHSERNTRFRGFDLRDLPYELSSFICQDCANHCEIHKVVFGQEEPLFYGSRCGKWDAPEKREQRRASTIPRLFRERYQALLHSYDKDAPDSPNGKTVGIPRGLFFNDLYPLWKAFFTELGFQVVTSDPTSRDIVRLGAENVMESPCLPIKVAHGHVLNLLTKEPDFLFLPVQSTMEKFDGAFDKSWNCPLTQALPFIIFSSASIRETLTTPDGKRPVVLRPTFHADRGRRWLRRVLRRLARQMGANENEVIERSVKSAFRSLDAFNEWQQRRGQEVFVNLKPDEKAIVLIGRVYNTCDAEMTLDLPEKLRDAGILAIPLDFLPLAEMAKQVSVDHPNMYWKAGQKILGAARMIASDPRLFALYVTNFNCGPDSYLLKFFGKEMEGKPFLTIEIDEHSADAGIITRCEAFLDTIRNAHTRGVRQPVEVFEFVRSHASGKKIYLPYMIDHGFVLAAAMRRCGARAEALPASDELTLELGQRYTSGRECYPSIITTGDIVKKTMADDFAEEEAAFFMPSSCGPCRFGQYNKLHRMVLDELNLPMVPVLIFDQTKSYHQHMATLGSGFRLQSWRAITILDSIQKMVLERRPYEVNRGETDTVYADLLSRLVSLTERDGTTFTDFARQAREALAAIKIDRSEIRPRIGIVGEIFVRSNPFANDFLTRKLETLGAQCALPPLEEWLDYIDFQRKRRSRLHLEGGWKDWAKQQLTEIVQERTAEPLRRQFDTAIEHFARELPTGEILKRGRSYLSPAVEGEAVLSLGRALEYVEHDFDGIINMMPFGCMPGTITSMLFHVLRTDHHIPIFNMVMDGTKDTGQDIRLEAFVHQCYEHLLDKDTHRHQ